MKRNNKYSKIFSFYDPKDNRTHGILKFFADDLTDAEKSEFIISLFDKGSWSLPTEISRSSGSLLLINETKEKFYQIFNTWVSERIEHFKQISNDARNPNIPLRLLNEFREAIFSARNLEFPVEILYLFEKFIKKSNPVYLKKILKHPINFVVDEFAIEEIEFLLNYFSKRYIENNTINLSTFLYLLLENFAHSYKIFNLSSESLKQLKILSVHLKENSNQNEYYNVVSILLIDLIEHKKLDLSTNSFNILIDNNIKKLERGNFGSLDFFRFLKHYNYPFKNQNFVIDLDILLNRIQLNIDLIKSGDEKTKKLLLTHYTNTTKQYFELLLFYFEYISEDLIIKYFTDFVKIIDELRVSFSQLLWYDEYLNYELIKGKIVSAVPYGFNIEIDEILFKRKIEEKQLKSNCTDEFIRQYRLGFMSSKSLKDLSSHIQLSNLTGKFNYESNNKIFTDETKGGNLEDFNIYRVNYSLTNKWSILTLVPYHKKLNSYITKYGMKSFFPFIELFLIEKSHEFLKTVSPFQNISSLKNKFFSSEFMYDYKINLSEDAFWNNLKKLRPKIYKETYLYNKLHEEQFNNIINAFNNGDIVNGVVIERTKGGMVVEIFGIHTFLPGSQIDLKPITDYDQFVGKTMEFKVVKINEAIKNAVVSHKVLVDSQRLEIIGKLEKGQVLEGTVKNITDFGAFIDLGGVDGLLYITDISWSRITHPNEVLKMDQKLQVVVIDYDNNKKRISLGLKQLLPHPWDSLPEDIEVGSKVKGKIVNIEDYGAFMEIVPGLEGLIHQSEITWSNKPINSRDFFKLGDEYKAVVVTLDKDERKMSLSLKQMGEDPWENIAEKYPVGSKLKSLVKNITPYGVFVELDDDIGGMIHISDLSWTKRYNHPSEFTNIGCELDVEVLEIDTENKKIVLGHKQLEENPHNAIIASLIVGTRVIGKVYKRITDYGICVELESSIIGLIPNTEISWGYILLNPEDYFKLGEEVEAVIISIDKIAQKVELSIKQLRPNPFISLPENIVIGNKVKGKVYKIITDYGFCVELESSIIGLISNTEISWGYILLNPEDYFKLGEEVEAVIISIDKIAQKVELSIKQLRPNPFISLPENIAIGAKVKGKVIKKEYYGALVEISQGIIGLIEVSQMSWSPIGLKKRRGKKTSFLVDRFCNVGDEIEAIILTLNRVEGIIELGVKELMIEPLLSNDNIFTIGKKYISIVIKIENNLIYVELKKGLIGMIHITEILGYENIMPLSNFTEIGSYLEVEILEIDEVNRRIRLCHRRNN